MKVLFVRFSSLGDVILTTGVIRKFKQLVPDAQADVFTYSQFRDVFKGLDFVNKIITFDRGDGLWRYMGLVQREINDYDYIIDLHGKLLSVMLDISSQADYYRYRKDSADRRSYVKKRKETPRLGMHVTEKYFETLIKPFGLNMPPLEDLRPQLFSQAHPVKGNILIHPFASKFTKTYPYMKELAEILLKNGLTPVFAGDGTAPSVEGAIYKTGKTSIRELFDTVMSCGAVISTDSGPLHIATALNKPTLGIFGSTTRHFGFFPLFKNVEIIEDNSVPCRPCHVHGLDACPKGHFDCMKNIKPEDVAEKLINLIRR